MSSRTFSIRQKIKAGIDLVVGCPGRDGLCLLCLFLAATSLIVAPGRARAENPGVVEVRDPSVYAQVVAISDVHGEYTHAETLLRNAHILDANDRWVGGRTLMVVVGDSIDKGPQSVEVLRLWMRLQGEAAGQGGRLIVLLGNHEAEFLADPQNHKTVATRADADALHVPLSDLTDPARPIGAFLRDLPVAARVGDWVFCHAGWIPDEPWDAFTSQARSILHDGKYGDPILAASDSILEKKAGANGKKWWRSHKEIRELERRLDADGLVGVVLGHQPGALGITNDVGESADDRLFKIDSGMAPPTEDDKDAGQPYAGHLLLFPNPSQLMHALPTKGVTAYSVDAQGARHTVLQASDDK